MAYVRTRCNVFICAYCVHMCTYTILNTHRENVWRHNESTSALSIATRMRIMDAHTHVSSHNIRKVHTYALYVCRVCFERESTEKQSVSVIHRASQISDNLFRKQWKRTPRCEWMNIQGLSNDWVSQKSGLLPYSRFFPAGLR